MILVLSSFLKREIYKKSFKWICHKEIELIVNGMETLW